MPPQMNTPSSQRPTRAVPGLSTPAAGFDQPFEMLEACHERVRRSLDLLARLIQHWQHNGPDAAAADAARDVARYFNLAAPHHHEDEERHILPLLHGTHETALVQAAHRILADHDRMRALWPEVDAGLQSLAGRQPPAQPLDWQRAAHAFIDLHAEHLRLEDELAFPAARASTSPARQTAMGQDMARRRGARSIP